MAKKQIKDQSKTKPVELDEAQLESLSGGPTAVENVMIHFTSNTVSPTSQTAFGIKTTTAGH